MEEIIERKTDSILAILRERESMKNEELMERMNISKAELDQLLGVLAVKEQVLRTNSGVIAINQVSYRLPKSKFPQEIENQSETEEAIAKAAVQFIRPKDTIYITSGNVGFLMLKYLKDMPLTLVTNSIVTANEVKYYDNLTTYVTGGQIRKKGTMVDPQSVEAIRGMHIDIAFLTGAGISAKGGLTNNTNDVKNYQRAVMETSRKKVLMMPAEKVGFRSFLKIADVDEFDVFITDKDAYTPTVQEIGARVGRVVIADEQ